MKYVTNQLVDSGRVRVPVFANTKTLEMIAPEHHPKGWSAIVAQGFLF
jgi:hypothetical protein